MRLYNPEHAGCFVYAVAPKNAKEGSPPVYQPISGMDFDDCQRRIEQRGNRSIHAHPVGRYDDVGRYCTYCPSVEGVQPGRFVLHPQAAREHKAHRWSD